MKFKLYSNILFLVPLYASIVYGIFWYVIIIGSVLIFSIIFHYFNETKFKSIDTISSLTLILSNFVLLFQGNLALPYSLVAILSAIVAILFYIRQSKYGYDFNHGMWHTFSALTCYYSILTSV